MITTQMIIKIMSTTYVPTTPIAGVRILTRMFPSIPPCLSTSCRKVQTRTRSTIPAPVFTYAWRFSLFDIRNVVPPNKRNGITYVVSPKSKNRISENVPPINPPNPKMLTNIKILTARASQIIISSFKKFCVFCFLLLPFLRPLFLDLAAIF